MKKLLVVGVIVLFLGLAIAPSINANIGELSEDSTLEDIPVIIEEDEEDCDCGISDTDFQPFQILKCFILYLRANMIWTIGGIMSLYNWAFGLFTFALVLVEYQLDRIHDMYDELGCDEFFPV